MRECDSGGFAATIALSFSWKRPVIPNEA